MEQYFNSQLRKFTFLLSFTTLFSQTGSLSGVISDIIGEPLIGANIIIISAPNGLGAATSFDGSYFISQIPTGTQTIAISYIGYRTKTFSDINIVQNQITHLDGQLEMETIQIHAVNVQAEKKLEGTAAALSEKQHALEIMDNVSSEQLSKTGDSHVADAVRRVTGVTITDDQNLVVRGLGDRYSHAQLNSVGMPSPEADKKSIPLDMFSTALIEGIDVAKSYRPDLPGTFGGGIVNIRTKLYPSRTIYKLKIGSGLNNNALPGESFVRNIRSAGDMFGFDLAKNKDLPAIFDQEMISYNSIPKDFRPDLLDTTYTQFGTPIVKADPLRSYLWFNEAYGKTKLIPNVFQSTIEKSGLPANLSLTYGTKYGSKNLIEFGYLIDANFSNKYKTEQDNFRRYDAKNDPEDNNEADGIDKILIPGWVDLDRTLNQYATNFGANVSVGLTINNNLQFGLRNVFTHTSKDEFMKSTGITGELDESNALLFSQSYKEKSINMTTFSIENSFPIRSLKNQFSFKFTSGYSDLYEPFITKTAWEKNELSDTYVIYSRNGSRPGELYSSSGNEYITGIAYDHTLKSKLGDIKFGLKIDRNKRDFKRRWLYLDWEMYSQIKYDSSRTHILESEPNSILDPEYWAHVNPADSTVIAGLYFSEQSSGFDAYTANENIDAFYLMYNKVFYDKFQISAGFRSEDYSMTMSPYHPVDEDKKPFYTDANGDTVILKIDNYSRDLLPAFTLNYSFSEKFKIRSSYSETLARAQFREYAPYRFQEFLGADNAIGFPYLKNTSIYASDLRFEYYPKGVELISVSFFHKYFTDPIEEALVGKSGLGYDKSWQNGDYGNINGLELELRNNLDILPAQYGFLFTNANLSISKSEVVVYDSVHVFRLSASGEPETVPFLNPVDETSRPLQGQSNFVFNMNVNYKNQSGWDVNLAYNTFSRRLLTLNGDIAGNIWELPFHSLNFVASKNVGKVKLSISLNNLLNDRIEYAHYFRGEYFKTQSYDPVQSFSFSVQLNN